MCGKLSHFYFTQLWRYGKGDYSQEKYGRDKILVGCSKSSRDEDELEEAVLQKWLVDVQCAGCKGLFYRSAPGVIVPDADWPRNGDIVVGSELVNTPGKGNLVDMFCSVYLGSF